MNFIFLELVLGDGDLFCRYGVEILMKKQQSKRKTAKSSLEVVFGLGTLHMHTSTGTCTQAQAPQAHAHKHMHMHTSANSSALP